MEKPIHILAVDDEESFTFFVKLNLETKTNNRFRVTTAGSGREGLNMARKLLPDLILLDIMMPGMSGAEVAEELMEDERTKNIPIIFITALVRKNEVKNEPGHMGGRTFIAKPVSKEELISKIEATLKLKNKV
ncbi:MAG: response regulator [Smithella sp.]|jgi:CheY-like chemotaxis protein